MFTAQRIADEYATLFDPMTRAAQLACLDHARRVRGEPRPTVADCLAIAKLYGVDGAALAASFGHLGWQERGRTIWVDAMDGEASSHVARQRTTRAQAIAFAFHCAVVELAAGLEP